MNLPRAGSPLTEQETALVIETLPPIPETFALGVCDYPEHVSWEQWKH